MNKKISLLLILFIGYLLLIQVNPKNEITSEADYTESLIETKKNYEKNVKENPNDVKSLRDLILVKSSLQEYTEAIQLNTQLIKMDPHNHMSYHSMANLQTSVKDWEKAIEYREKAFKIEKTSHMLYYLSTNYIVIDSNHALILLNDLDNYSMETEKSFLLRYKQALESFNLEKNYDNTRALAEFVADVNLFEAIIEQAIAETTDSFEKVKLEGLKDELAEM